MGRNIRSFHSGRLRAWFYRHLAGVYLGKPDLGPLLAIKFPTLRSLLRAALNELFFRAGSLRGFRLTSANLEVTNRCNLACVMCPVNTDMVRRKADLPTDSFRSAVLGAPGLETMLLFQWGEPLLVKDLFERIAFARERGIRVMITTNGTLLDEANCRRILASGLERVTVSVDGLPETHEAVRGFPYRNLEENVARLVRMRDAAGSPLRIDVNMTLWEVNDAEAALVRAAWAAKVDRVQFIPRFTEGRRTKPCRELWRGSTVVLSNGDVVPCCRDSEGVLRLGNLSDATLPEIWQGKAMQHLRARHLRREFPPLCATCTEYETPNASPRFS